MILDKQNQFSAAQAVTVTAASTNVIDLGPTSAALNANGALGPEIFFNVDTTFTAAGAATLTITVRSSASSSMTSPVLHAVSTALTVASLTAGSVVAFTPRIPQPSLRYVDVHYTVATGPMTAGAISAAVVADRQAGFGG
jgi:hypothetical protein